MLIGHQVGDNRRNDDKSGNFRCDCPVYLPQTEHRSHYFQARLSKQFDAVIHIDVTRAVEPLQP